jgi:hydroxypyruvate reductase
VIGNAARAVAGAAFRARALGYDVHVHSVDLEGEARAVGKELARLGRQIRDIASPVSAPAVLLVGGETTVVVRGNGKGGRNQEVALAAALALEGTDRVLVLSFATDGVDGPTDAAGALATGSTLRRARRVGLDAEAVLERNDAYPFFDAVGDLVMTGPTGTNVMDLMIVLVGD